MPKKRGLDSDRKRKSTQDSKPAAKPGAMRTYFRDYAAALRLEGAGTHVIVYTDE